MSPNKKSMAKVAKQTARMGTASIPRLLFEFGLPAVTGVFVNALYNVVDTIFVGRGVGEIGIAATTAAFPAVIVMIAFAVLIGSGGNALMAIRLGEKNHNAAEKILGNSFMLMTLISVVVTTLGLVFIEPILLISGATKEVLPYAKGYMSIIFWGMLFQCLAFSMNNFIRTTGKPKLAMITIISGAIINTLLDYIFIMKLGWGIRGAAWATIIAQLVSAILVMQYFLGKKAPIRLRFSGMRLRLGIVKSILFLGLPSFLMQIASTVVNVVLNTGLVAFGVATAVGGAGALAAMGVVTKTAQFFVMPVLGFVMAAQPLIGYNYGAHKYDRVKKTFWMGSAIVTTFLVLMWLFTQIWPGAIVTLFGINNPAVLEFAITAQRIYLFMLPVIGFQMMASNYFQSTGQPLKSAILTLTRQVIFLIPLIMFLPLLGQNLGKSPGFVLLLIPLAAPIADTFSTALSAFLVLRDMNNLDDKHARVTRSAEEAEAGILFEEPEFIPPLEI